MNELNQCIARVMASRQSLMSDTNFECTENNIEFIKNRLHRKKDEIKESPGYKKSRATSLLVPTLPAAFTVTNAVVGLVSLCTLVTVSGLTNPLVALPCIFGAMAVIGFGITMWASFSRDRIKAGIMSYLDGPEQDPYEDRVLMIDHLLDHLDNYNDLIREQASNDYIPRDQYHLGPTSNSGGDSNSAQYQGANNQIAYNANSMFNQKYREDDSSPSVDIKVDNVPPGLYDQRPA